MKRTKLHEQIIEEAIHVHCIQAALPIMMRSRKLTEEFITRLLVERRDLRIAQLLRGRSVTSRKPLR